MTAIVSGSRSKSTWLTGAAGLLVLAAAFVMMACAAPTAHEPLHGHATRSATESVTTFCGHSASGGNPARVRPCVIGPSELSAWTKPYARSSIVESRSARLAGQSRPMAKSAAN